MNCGIMTPTLILFGILDIIEPSGYQLNPYRYTFGILVTDSGASLLSEGALFDKLVNDAVYLFIDELYVNLADIHEVADSLNGLIIYLQSTTYWIQIWKVKCQSNRTTRISYIPRPFKSLFTEIILALKDLYSK